MADNPQDATDSDQSRAVLVQHSFHLLPPTSTPPSLVSAFAVKSKRRRTSPQDQAVLEAAYQKNSKPDKTERASIVSQVELGEKEVQIWFQNRRQNDRRKSKPLEPHELVAHLRTHTASPVPHQVASSSPKEESLTQNVHPTQSLAPIEAPNRPVSRASSIHDLLNPSSSAETDNNGASHSASQATAAPSTPPSSIEEQAKVAASEEVEKKVDQSDEVESSSDTGSARKRNHDEMIGVKDKIVNSAIQSITELPPQAREPLARSTSMVRLAMTVDGAVKIRTDNEPTPSPEKPRAAPPLTSQGKVRAGFSRSKSAMNDGEVSRQSKAVSAGFGRSRDARTWEFYCDSTAKDALSIQAEAETAGSAVGAINLVRSNSFKSRVQALSPALSKNNARVTPTSKNGKPTLSRAKSSLGRLQGSDVKGSSGRGPKSLHMRSESGDSDKENWAPGTRSSINPLRRTEPSVNDRPVLQENESMIFRDATSTTQQSRLHPKERPGSQQSPSKEKAKGEELDCVHGLLSLSRGDWK